jgi:hypothetical protein
MTFDFQSCFERALPYQQFLQEHGTAEHRQRWQAIFDKVTLLPEQKALLAGFRRKIQVLCMAGVWCGDCVNACPIFQHFATASSMIELRFIHRVQKFDPKSGDPDTLLANELSICGAPRVPVLLFLSEDGFECERFGERTLATYRHKAAQRHGASCPTGLVAPPQDLLAANTTEWLTHFERVELMLLTSPRLMKLHHEI